MVCNILSINSTKLRTKGRGVKQIWISALKNKRIIIIIIITWKYFPFNKNPTHAPFTCIITLPQKQKLLSDLSAYLYLMGWQLE